VIGSPATTLVALVSDAGNDLTNTAFTGQD
jgi:hypothetical protein